MKRRWLLRSRLRTPFDGRSTPASSTGGRGDEPPFDRRTFRQQETKSAHGSKVQVSAQVVGIQEGANIPRGEVV